MNANKTLRAKKLILINRDFQLRFAKVGALIGILSAFLTAVFVLVPLYQFEIILPKLAFSDALPELKESFEMTLVPRFPVYGLTFPFVDQLSFAVLLELLR